MSESAELKDQKPSNKGLGVEYLLKELEFQVEIETKARDRMENMVQYLLTTIAAVIGATLLINEMQVNSVLLLFIASLLVFVFATSAFYRSCRLRYITTYARVTRNNIRCLLVKSGVSEADQLIELEGNPSGFCKRMLQKLVLLLVLCSLLGGATGVFALLLIFHIKELPIYITSSQQMLLIVVPLVLIIIVGIVLETVLVNQKTKSEQFISDPDWQELPDYDL